MSLQCKDELDHRPEPGCVSSYSVSRLASVMGWQLAYSLLAPVLMVAEVGIVFSIVKHRLHVCLIEVGAAGRMALVRDLGGRSGQVAADNKQKPEMGWQK